MTAAVPTPPFSRPGVPAMAWRQLWRDWRAGELRLLVLAVTLAVAALCAVGFLADRLDLGLARDAAQLLGGDAVVASDQPLPDKVQALALSLKLQSTRSASFPSMARAPDDKGGASRLVSVKAVGQDYPLRGRITVSQAPGGPTQALKEAPERGTVWADAEVLDKLGLKVGDALMLGELSLRLSHIIVNEPDRGAGFMSFAPRVMLHEADLPATGLIQPASRVTYRLAVAGALNDRPAVTTFVQRAQEQIKQDGLRGVRVESLESGRPEMRQTLDRAGKFLKLVALLSALLAAVAVGLASRDFAGRHLNDCAMLRVLGQSQRRIAWSYGLEFAVVGLAASLAGVLLGFVLHHGFVWLLSGLIAVDLPLPSVWPALFGLGVGMTLLLGFGLPPVLQLARVPPLRVMRRDVGNLKASSLVVLAAGTLGFVALLMAVSSDLTLGLIASGGFAVAVLLFAGLAWLAVMALRRWVPEAGGPRWLLLATRQIAARPVYAVLQVSALSVGLLALALLVLLRTDLIDSWRNATPPDAPNRFVINVQPEQGEAFRAALAGAGVARYDWYPMIRGRLVAINGKTAGPELFTDDRARRLVEREFNMSHSAKMPEHNQVVGGAWKVEEAGAISVEEGLAETLGLKLGDRLRFDVAGQTVEASIASLRKVDWTSMRANFFVIFPVAEMAELPASYIAAFRAPGRAGFDNALSHDFPNITMVDVSAQIQQVQAVLNQVIQAVQFLFAFTLATGLVVLLAAVSTTREARTREFAVMRAMGAGRQLLAQVQRAELLGMGALAGLLAGTAAVVVGGLLARYVFEFRWTASPWVPLFTMGAGALLALAAGWWGLRGVLTRPVVATLREAGDS
ncbi:MAG: ABC transporter permease [Burkholderiaceae bacterium]|nr:ABC transporter permease [Burkholderiaceae bacterium]